MDLDLDSIRKDGHETFSQNFLQNFSTSLEKVWKKSGKKSEKKFRKKSGKKSDKVSNSRLLADICNGSNIGVTGTQAVEAVGSSSDVLQKLKEN